MNIQQAKEEIKRTYRAYMEKNEDGTRCIPTEQQRPVLMIGPPGIGKTAIMRQIAEETGCGLLSYTMTHHTRQSAIGLPFISRRVFDGKEYSITEYTMSEIVAAIYDYMNETGKKSGILFLDEINCVSETLSPVMLQLLQNKTFGNHKLPKDWLIVAAGNPPEYNKSVRELDMVTMDRVRHMEIEADLEIWLDYALERDIHPAIRTYLTACPDHFYRIDNKTGGQSFATARGWEDLSSMLYSYEKAGNDIDRDFFREYIQHDEIAHSFAVYYKLFRAFSPKETGSLYEMLMDDKDKLFALPSAACLSVSALFFHQIWAEAEAFAQEKRALKRQNELIALLPETLRENAAKEFFENRKNAAGLKEVQGVLTPVQAIEEYRILRQMECEFAEWMMQGADSSFSAYEKALADKKSEKLLEKASSVLKKTEDAYAVLSACPQGESSLLYLTSDLSRADSTKMVLKEYNCSVYEQWAEQLFSSDEEI